MEIKKIFETMVNHGASDLFLKIGGPVNFRIDGSLKTISGDVVTEEDMEEIIRMFLTKKQADSYEKDQEVDFSVNIDGWGRFRGSIFNQNGKEGAVFRYIKETIQTFEELNLPRDVLSRLSFERRGLVLVTGSTGSGKSTTIASMIEFINQNMPYHIITIEDPIEFVFTDKKSVIEQREVGVDTPSYIEALRHIMYQSPDVIFIGNIRDEETMAAAMTAAETGQVVLSTIHSINATQTIERIVNFYPPRYHQEIRVQLSLLLKGIISQRLVPVNEGKGRVPACETMVLTPTIAALIREGKTNEIITYIEEGKIFGMETFDQCLARLCLEGKISVQEAKRFCDSEVVLDLALKGIKRSGQLLDKP